jgi:glycosyltransferase involved in cell wall biosynthesis
MCTYNGARYLREQLESISSQSRCPDELVICDDRSTDDTAAIVREFAARAPFAVRLHINETNLGSTRNFEKAIGLCNGDIIALSDQDDIWLPAKLARMEVEFARSPAVGLVFTNAEVVDEGLRPLGYTIWRTINFDQRKQEMVSRGAAFEVELMGNVVTGAAMAFRSRFRSLVLPLYETAVRRYGETEWNLIHDGWIALLVAATADLVPIDEPLIRYRQHSRQQFGVRLPVPKRYKPMTARARAAEQYKKFFEDELRLLKVIRDRLAAKRGAFDCEAALAELEARIRHWRTRASMPENRLGRVPLALTELLSLRYFRYSNGVFSAAKDLLL